MWWGGAGVTYGVPCHRWLTADPDQAGAVAGEFAEGHPGGWPAAGWDGQRLARARHREGRGRWLAADAA
jgi:hypothetical protein